MVDFGNTEDDRLPAGQLGLAQAIDELLARLPQSVAEAVRLGAIPHGFDAELLDALRGTRANTDTIMDELRRLGLVTETTAGWFTYHDSLRTYLLRQQQRQPDAYRQINSRAAAYFEARLTRDENPKRERDRLEHMYHQLAADEPAGLDLLRRFFEGGWSTYELGLVERLLDYAIEQSPVLSPSSRDWLRYFQARLSNVLSLSKGQAFTDLETSQTTFEELAVQATDPWLRGAAGRSLAETLVQSRQWVAAIVAYHTALAIFRELNAPIEIARTQAGLAALHVDLAETTGGLRDEMPAFESAWMQRLYYLQHAPFLIYRWLSRRFSVVPNLYFGTDYQNWIIIRFLYTAIRWFTRADRTLARVDVQDDPSVEITRTHIRIRLTDLRHRVGRWSWAEKHFEILADDPAVQASSYLMATVQLGRGRAHLARGDVTLALDDLQTGLATFQRYGDHSAAGTAAQLLGLAFADLGDRDAAIDAYMIAANAFYSIDDLVNATESLVAARELQAEEPGGRDVDTRVTALTERLERRAYVARFPGALHHIFRRLAVYGVLPLTYLLVLVLTLSLQLLGGVVELAIKALPNYAKQITVVSDVILVLPFLLALPLSATWVYEFIYVAVGLFVIHVLPLRLLTREQPIYFVTDAWSLSRYNSQGILQKRLNWSDVTVIAFIDRCIWRRPLALLSRFVVVSASAIFVVNGIINHYSYFKHEAISHLRVQPHSISRHSFNFSLLNRVWILVTLGVSVLISVIALHLNPAWQALVVVTPSGTKHRLYLAGLVYQLNSWIILIGPLFALLQLLLNRRAAQRTLGNRIQWGFGWAIWLAFLFFLFLTVGQLWNLTR